MVAQWFIHYHTAAYAMHLCALLKQGLFWMPFACSYNVIFEIFLVFLSSKIFNFTFCLVEGDISILNYSKFTKIFLFLFIMYVYP